MSLTMTEHMPAAAKPFRISMLLPTLIVDGIVPIAIYKGLEHYGVSPAWALAGGCTVPALNNLRTWIVSRQLDPIGLLIMASIASGAAASVVSGDVFWRVVTDCVLNAAWGSTFLISLFFARPVLFYLIREVVAGNDTSRAGIWEGLWNAGLIRHTLRWMTGIWAAVYLAQILIEVALARTLAADTVVTVASIVNTACTLALILFTHRTMRATRTRFEREEGPWPL
ncbi:MAG TPA: VC0807 family protein [Rhizomicrobium sp.]|jgi:hypothetical protein|nr:VC0807 family protein [Rhizomicrobium sp.]